MNNTGMYWPPMSPQMAEAIDKAIEDYLEENTEQYIIGHAKDPVEGKYAIIRKSDGAESELQLDAYLASVLMRKSKRGLNKFGKLQKFKS